MQVSVFANRSCCITREDACHHFRFHTVAFCNQGLVILPGVLPFLRAAGQFILKTVNDGRRMIRADVIAQGVAVTDNLFIGDTVIIAAVGKEILGWKIANGVTPLEQFYRGL